MNEKQRLEAVRMIPLDLSVHFSYPENAQSQSGTRSRRIHTVKIPQCPTPLCPWYSTCTDIGTLALSLPGSGGWGGTLGLALERGAMFGRSTSTLAGGDRFGKTESLALPTTPYRSPYRKMQPTKFFRSTSVFTEHRNSSSRIHPARTDLPSTGRRTHAVE